MLNQFLPKRFSILKAFILIFISFSFLVRISFTIWNFNEVNIYNLIPTFIYGFVFDIGTISFFAIPYCIYLLIIPQKLVGSIFDKIITYIGFILVVFIINFSFFCR